MRGSTEASWPTATVDIMASGGAVTGVAVVSEPWTDGTDVYESASIDTRARIGSGQAWKSTSGSGATFDAGIAQGGTLQIELQLMPGGTGGGTGALRRDVHYLVSCG